MHSVHFCGGARPKNSYLGQLWSLKQSWCICIYYDGKAFWKCNRTLFEPLLKSQDGHFITFSTNFWVKNEANLRCTFLNQKIFFPTLVTKIFSL